MYKFIKFVLYFLPNTKNYRLFYAVAIDQNTNLRIWIDLVLYIVEQQIQLEYIPFVFALRRNPAFANTLFILSENFLCYIDKTNFLISLCIWQDQSNSTNYGSYNNPILGVPISNISAQVNQKTSINKVCQLGCNNINSCNSTRNWHFVTCESASNICRLNHHFIGIMRVLVVPSLLELMDLRNIPMRYMNNTPQR
jgi:hypothetical protein